MAKRSTFYEPRLWQALAAAAAMLLATAPQTAAHQPQKKKKKLYRWTSPTPVTSSRLTRRSCRRRAPIRAGDDEWERRTRGPCLPGSAAGRRRPERQRIVLAPGSALCARFRAAQSDDDRPRRATAGNTPWCLSIGRTGRGADKNNIPIAVLRAHTGQRRQPHTVGFGADTPSASASGPCSWAILASCAPAPIPGAHRFLHRVGAGGPFPSSSSSTRTRARCPAPAWCRLRSRDLGQPVRLECSSRWGRRALRVHIERRWRFEPDSIGANMTFDTTLA
jgi:hypothetical protein